MTITPPRASLRAMADTRAQQQVEALDKLHEAAVALRQAQRRVDQARARATRTGAAAEVIAEMMAPPLGDDDTDAPVG